MMNWLVQHENRELETGDIISIMKKQLSASMNQQFKDNAYLATSITGHSFIVIIHLRSSFIVISRIDGL